MTADVLVPEESESESESEEAAAAAVEPDWVELRVHGVRASQPENMLGVDHVVQVAGDELGRVFRRADSAGVELPSVGPHRIEAYHWGRLTSGSIVAGLWLLLAPFGLVNAAQFTLERPTSRPARWAHAVAGAMLRLVGLAMTALFVLAAAVITMDLWAWQNARAGSGFSYALAMAAPVGLLIGYLVLARARPALNADPAPAEPSASRPGPAHQPSELVRPAFFEGDPDSRALRILHLAAGLTLVALLGLAPEVLRAGGPAAVAFRLVLALLGVIAVLVVVLGDPGHSSRVDWQDPRPGSVVALLHANAARIALVLAGLSGFALLVAAATVLIRPPDPGAPLPSDPANAPLHYPGVDWASYLVLATAVVGLVVLTVANLALAWCERGSTARRHPRFAPYLRGMAASGLASLGVFLGVGYVGAFSTASATALRTERDGRPVAVHVPELFSRAVYAWGVTSLVILAVVGYALVRRQLSLPTLGRRAVRDFTARVPPGALRLPRRWVAQVASAMWAGRLKNSLGCVLAIFTTVGFVLTAAVVVDVLPILLVPPAGWPQLGRSAVEAQGWLGQLSRSETWPPVAPTQSTAGRTFLMTLGTLTLSTLATVLLFLGRTALQGESARRGTNVLWDVIAFWPRSAHPFVPATYSQRAVLDIEARVRWHLDPLGGGAGRVVVCAHSQGSLLAFGALLRIAAEPRGDALLPRIGLLTFGSQLQVMFARGFPAYVNLAAITQLFAQLDGRWRNLYRDTDPLAGPVLSWFHRSAPTWIDGAGVPRRTGSREEFGPDWRLLDPPLIRTSTRPVSTSGPPLQTHVLLPVRGHGDYWRDEAWTAAVDAVR